ncbi:protein of unknown function UPF0001 [Syntrophobotulus glycolicus DSM 8271]|uniref:Pyridoxal phosphate homeostasis protein n=1 Tax=Syntrophobotulus glycolicus (strain DSM 8271 / FlGlyR) TaxID=645991 RepID=F0T011_SYNGF|nr:YggS family pyridoxal phosphate-dependent enzyme [Syntrophobotulus glycolicus]ADY55022.1 protein of unknown function UPF0001 [Syntrophobotulus glycolicus DSM 8271]
MSIKQNLLDIRARIVRAAANSGRRIEDIKLVAVSKTVAIEGLAEAYAENQKVFGENRVQEWQDKYEHLAADCEWHIIGSLQTNKVKYLNSRIVLIHSLDRLPLLEKLNSEGEKKGGVWNALVQVNVARDEAKAGLEVNEVRDFIENAVAFPKVKIKGLMTIGALNATAGETRDCFHQLRELRNSLQTVKYPEKIQELSMGMSDDFETAIEEGATIVRIGSRIFGHRSEK